ncbi:MAG: hypothetical protein HEQ29_10680 [Dolichospermum sp. LBC05a]|nr:hypothetical protein [Dolichospermum sp. OL01]MCO5797212.1 hypothetical protein [Dolichospermum sp. OL03]MCS6282048.1 hypothetical protein [Dolichospermum sp.]QSV58749.1 MAG: hypothetical protein HEQ29_10680 [Dolichospermum sp. LBC05a]
MEEKFQILDSEQGDIIIAFDYRTFKLSLLVSLMTEVVLTNQLQELNQKLAGHSNGTLPCHKSLDWRDKGVSCEILKPGKDWKEGKVRIKVTLEFSPDEPEVEQITEIGQTSEIKEPESPLDDLRRKINEATS